MTAASENNVVEHSLEEFDAIKINFITYDRGWGGRLEFSERSYKVRTLMRRASESGSGSRGNDLDIIIKTHTKRMRYQAVEMSELTKHAYYVYRKILTPMNLQVLELSGKFVLSRHKLNVGKYRYANLIEIFSNIYQPDLGGTCSHGGHENCIFMAAAGLGRSAVHVWKPHRHRGITWWEAPALARFVVQRLM